MRKEMDSLQDIERLLAQGLVPVQPDESFVRHMAARLQEPRTFEIERARQGVVHSHLGAFFLMGLGLGLFLTGLGLWFWWRRRLR